MADVVHGHERLDGLAAAPGLRAAPGRKPLVVGNHDFGRRNGVLDAAGHDAATGILTVDTDPPLVLTHIPMGVVPPGWVNLHGHVHNEALRTTPHINVCVEHTGYKPLPLNSVLVLVKHLLAANVPDGATTAERIRSAEAADRHALTSRPRGAALLTERRPVGRLA